MSAQALSDRVEQWTGVTITRDAIANLENGRRTRVSVEEVFALAYALGCAPVHLLTPSEEDERVSPFPKAFASRPDQEQGPGVTPRDLRGWIRGDAPLPEAIPSQRERARGMHEHDTAEEVQLHRAAEHAAIKAIDELRRALAGRLAGLWSDGHDSTRLSSLRDRANTYATLAIQELNDRGDEVER